jgi:hypothetical protein
VVRSLSLSIVYNSITNTASELIAVCTPIGATFFFIYTLNGVDHRGHPTCGAGPTIIPFSPPLAKTSTGFAGLTSLGCGSGL